jgi:hypothetical protein
MRRGVTYDCVVSWPDCALQPGMCLKEEIKVVDGRDPTIYYSPSLGIGGFIRVILVRGVEASVMSFPTDGDGDLWFAGELGTLACCEDTRIFNLDDLLELAFRDTWGG